MGFLRSLHARLSGVLLTLFALIALLFGLLTLYTSQRYYEELSQKANEFLAKRLVSEKKMLIEDALSSQMLDDLAHDLAMVQPGIELYVLGPTGEIWGSSVGVGLERPTISLIPLNAFLNHSKSFPLRGDDPKSLSAKKIFSVAPIPLEGEPEGYLYILLSDEALDSASQMARDSVVLNLSLWSGLALLLIFFALAFSLFFYLTRRLRRLSLAMSQFSRSDFSSELSLNPKSSAGDEIDALEQTFVAMAGRIAEQFDELKTIDSLRRELVSNVSHDLRTPLAALRGYLETLSLKPDLKLNDRENYLHIAIKHAERLSKMVEELFELSKLDAGQVRPQFESFIIQELLYDISQKFQLLAEKKAVMLKPELLAEPLMVRLDIALIERVLTNLLDNALRHTPQGGEVKLVLERFEDKALIGVVDSGQGISPEALPHIFDRFFRAEARVATNHQGAGLGLAISQRIVELHGSKIEVGSSPQGSHFSFTLPLSKI
ncbi:MAG: ATP-binding protein [Deinococcales bacterium]